MTVKDDGGMQPAPTNGGPGQGGLGGLEAPTEPTTVEVRNNGQTTDLVKITGKATGLYYLLTVVFVVPTV